MHLGRILSHIECSIQTKWFLTLSRPPDLSRVPPTDRPFSGPKKFENQTEYKLEHLQHFDTMLPKCDVARRSPNDQYKIF